MIDPKALKPGTTFRYKDERKVHTLAARKADGTGWWLAEGGGLIDSAWGDDQYTVVAEPDEPVRFTPKGWREI